MIEQAKTDGMPVKELIAIRIGAQEYCVDVMRVREIRVWTPATTLPQTPDYVRGMINLRGTVLPIVDLAARLGFAPTEPSSRHAIVVVQIANQMVGLLVEGVSDIFTITEDQIQPTPDVASDMAKEFVQGIIAMDGRMISMIVLDSILPTDLPKAA